MRKNAALAALMLVAISTTAANCKKKTPEPTPEPAPVVVTPPPPAPAPVDTTGTTLKRVYFGFDSTGVTSDSSEALELDVSILQKNPETRIEIQGHADERGTTEYNLALGQRRAEAVKERMTRMGVATSRLATISYGEERPLVSDSNESAWSQNRRAEFRVLSTGSAEAVKGTVP
jgi:peptidoglycan-associated lipoprotein